MKKNVFIITMIAVMTVIMLSGIIYLLTSINNKSVDIWDTTISSIEIDTNNSVIIYDKGLNLTNTPGDNTIYLSYCDKRGNVQHKELTYRIDGDNSIYITYEGVETEYRNVSYIIKRSK